jgi:hypothetical protein
LLCAVRSDQPFAVRFLLRQRVLQLCYTAATTTTTTSLLQLQFELGNLVLQRQHVSA